MHELGRYVQSQMDERGWRAADLARASGVSKEVISNLLSRSRDSLTRPPAPATIKGLARAIGGANAEDVLWLAVAQSMGLPVGEAITVPDVTLLRDEELLAELRRRLLSRPVPEETGDDERPTTQPIALDDHRPVTKPQPAVTPPSASGKAARRRGTSRNP